MLSFRVIKHHFTIKTARVHRLSARKSFPYKSTPPPTTTVNPSLSTHRLSLFPRKKTPLFSTQRTLGMKSPISLPIRLISTPLVAISLNPRELCVRFLSHRVLTGYVCVCVGLKVYTNPDYARREDIPQEHTPPPITEGSCFCFAGWINPF